MIINDFANYMGTYNKVVTITELVVTIEGIIKDLHMIVQDCEMKRNLKKNNKKNNEREETN